MQNINSFKLEEMLSIKNAVLGSMSAAWSHKLIIFVFVVSVIFNLEKKSTFEILSGKRRVTKKENF